MEETFGLTPVVTVDESWSYLDCSHTHPWSASNDDRPVGVDNPIASEKRMFTVLSSIKGLLTIEGLGRGDRFKTAYFCDVMIAKLVQTSYPGGVVPGRKNFHWIWTVLALRFLQGRPNSSMENNSSDYATRHIR
jgi:hypothetical protein